MTRQYKEIVVNTILTRNDNPFESYQHGIPVGFLEDNTIYFINNVKEKPVIKVFGGVPTGKTELGRSIAKYCADLNWQVTILDVKTTDSYGSLSKEYENITTVAARARDKIDNVNDALRKYTAYNTTNIPRLLIIDSYDLILSKGLSYNAVKNLENIIKNASDSNTVVVLVMDENKYYSQVVEDNVAASVECHFLWDDSRRERIWITKLGDQELYAPTVVSHSIDKFPREKFTVATITFDN